MIGRILCSLGFHRWAWRDRFIPERMVVLTLAHCRRCDTPEAVVNIDRVQATDWR